MPPCANPLLIPVAVHYQAAGIDAACAEQMAIDQVDRLNLDYGGTNADINNWLVDADGWRPEHVPPRGH